MTSVLFVTDSPEIWGAELSLLDLATEGSELGHRVCIAAPSASPLHARCKERKIESVPLDLLSHPALQRGGLRYARASDIPGELRATVLGISRIRKLSRTYDVIVSFSLWRNVEVALSGFGLKTRTVADLHETFEGSIGRFASRVSLALFNLVISPSRYVAAIGGAPKGRSLVIPRAVDFGSGVPRPIDAEAPKLRIGIFGQLRLHKGHEILFKAAGRASKEVSVEVLVVGEGGDEEVADLMAKTDEDFPNLIDRHARTSNPVGLMATCHVIVNTSLHEAFGRTMIEAMAAGTLPVAAGEAGPAEIIRSAGIGVVVPRDVDSLARLFVTLAQDRSLVKQAQLDGPPAARRLYNRNRVGRAYFDALSTSIGSYRRDNSEQVDQQRNTKSPK